MTFLSDCSPITAFIYFIAVTLPPMMSTDPVIALTSFLGAFLSSIPEKSGVKRRGFFFMLIMILSLINPIFSHNGITVLFLINDTPITLEAVIYGITSAVSLTSVLFWFACFSGVMTSDRLLYLFGLFSPKLSLVLSSAIRYVPLFLRRSREVEDAGRALGLYKDDNIIDTVRGKLYVFSVMVTWALEDGIHTADSMAARGYGIGHRTSFSLFRIRRIDTIHMTASLLLTLPMLILFFRGAMNYEFYPLITPPSPSAALTLSYAAYASLALLPTITELTGRLKWKYLMSKI